MDILSSFIVMDRTDWKLGYVKNMWWNYERFYLFPWFKFQAPVYDSINI